MTDQRAERIELPGGYALRRPYPEYPYFDLVDHAGRTVALSISEADARLLADALSARPEPPMADAGPSEMGEMVEAKQLSDRVVLPNDIEVALINYREAQYRAGTHYLSTGDCPDAAAEMRALRDAIATALSRATQAPAVPEELRRLSEAAPPGAFRSVGSIPSDGFDCFWIENAEGGIQYGSFDGPQSSQFRKALAELSVASIAFVRTLLADAAKNREGGRNG